MYKLTMAIMKAVTLTLLVATAMFYLLEGESARTYAFAVLSVFALIVALMIWGEHHSKLKNAPSSSVTLFEQEGSIATALRLVRQLPERPVMYYKGEVFDFVHNDPTQPDPA